MSEPQRRNNQRVARRREAFLAKAGDLVQAVEGKRRGRPPGSKNKAKAVPVVYFDHELAERNKVLAQELVAASRPPGFDSGWRVHEADHESVVFLSPSGHRYTASCVFGNFAYEGEEAFDSVRGGALTAERLKQRFRMPVSAKGRFKVEFPDILGRVGRCVDGAILRGFRLFTPSRHMLDFHFLRRPAPIELKADLEALFGV